MTEVAAAGTSDRRLRNVGDLFEFSAAEVRELSDLGRRLWPDPARVASVASGGVYYGLARMYEALRDQEGHETRAFLIEEEAMAWLLS